MTVITDVDDDSELDEAGYPRPKFGRQDTTWQDHALCAEVGPFLFFPDDGEHADDAKKVCPMCEVRQECDDYAEAIGEDYGVWGGITERERRASRRAA